MKRNRIPAATLAVIFCNFYGCGPGVFDTQDSTSKTQIDDQSETGVDSQEVREWETDNFEPGQQPGLNGGQVFDFDPPNFRGEWVSYDDNDITRVFISSSDSQNKKPIQIDSMFIKRSDNSIFSLDPDNPNEARSMVTYSLDDRTLAIAMNLGVTVEMKIDGKTYRGNSKTERIANVSIFCLLVLRSTLQSY